jgi:hypothetical protein
MIPIPVLRGGDHRISGTFSRSRSHGAGAILPVRGKAVTTRLDADASRSERSTTVVRRASKNGGAHRSSALTIGIVERDLRAVGRAHGQS